MHKKFIGEERKAPNLLSKAQYVFHLTSLHFHKRTFAPQQALHLLFL